MSRELLANLAHKLRTTAAWNKQEAARLDGDAGPHGSMEAAWLRKEGATLCLIAGVIEETLREED